MRLSERFFQLVDNCPTVMAACKGSRITGDASFQKKYYPFISISATYNAEIQWMAYSEDTLPINFNHCQLIQIFCLIICFHLLWINKSFNPTLVISPDV